jgi:hypothetical protein
MSSVYGLVSTSGPLFELPPTTTHRPDVVRATAVSTTSVEGSTAVDHLAAPSMVVESEETSGPKLALLVANSSHRDATHVIAVSLKMEFAGASRADQCFPPSTVSKTPVIVVPGPVNPMTPTAKQVVGVVQLTASRPRPSELEVNCHVTPASVDTALTP